MLNRKAISMKKFAISELHSGRGVLTIPVIYIDIPGMDIIGALWLNQLLLWQAQHESEISADGWVFWTTNSVFERCRITKRQIARVKAIWKRLGVLEEQIKGIPPRSYYRVNGERLDALVAEVPIKGYKTSPSTVTEGDRQRLQNVTFEGDEMSPYTNKLHKLECTTKEKDTPIVPKSSPPASRDCMNVLFENPHPEEDGYGLPMPKGKTLVELFTESGPEPSNGRSKPSSTPGPPQDTTPPIKIDPGASQRAKRANPGTAEDIYKLYPRKVGRGAAIKAIQKALTIVDPVVLREAVMVYAEETSHWPESEKQYIPHPATWFNQQRWEDDKRQWHRGGGSERQLSEYQKVVIKNSEIREMKELEGRFPEAFMRKDNPKAYDRMVELEKKYKDYE